MKSNTKRTGNKGEKIATKYLAWLGYVLVCTNYRSTFGEIDIILRDGKYIVFVEVKTRKENTCFSGLEAVDKRKRSHIISAALDYILNNPKCGQPRFDVIEVLNDGLGKFKKINYIKNAFDTEEYDEVF